MSRIEHQERAIREFAHVFRRGISLLEEYYSPTSGTSDQSSHGIGTDLQHRDNMVLKLEYHSQLAKGLMGQSRYLMQVGSEGAAEHNLYMALYYQVDTLIFASAARKANRALDGSVLDQQIEGKILDMRQSVLGDPSSKEHLDELQKHIEVAEARGWQRSDGSDRLITVIGATWCSDTAKVVDILGSLSLPTHLVIVDEDNLAEEGFLKYSQHGSMAFRHNLKDEFMTIPVIIFLDGSRMVEPDSYDFMIQLVNQKLI